MSSVEQLAARDHVDIAYLMVWQGCPFMWTNRPEIAGSGVGSWIGTDYGPRRVLEGLDLQGQTITFATEMGEGRPDTDDGLSVKITDFDGELIEFFRDRTLANGLAVALGSRLGPKDDPAPVTLIGMSGDDVPIRGKWINSEAIGPDGQRSYYSLFPDGDPAGQDHAAYQGDIQALAPSYVYDVVTHLEGRRVSLYCIFRDVDTGEWPSWQDQHESGWSLLWVGCLTNEAEASGRTWTLKCEGPSSWLRKQLGAQRPEAWLPVSGNITLSDAPGAREDLIALSFVYQQVGTNTIEYGGSTFFTGSDQLPLTGTAADFRLFINERIATVAAAAGPDITWSTARNAEASLGPEGALTRIEQLAEAPAFVRAGLWACALHEKVWRALGFEPYVQAATAFDTEYEIQFKEGYASGMPGIPGPGFWVGHFWTVPVGYSSVGAAGADADNSGKVRIARKIAPEDIAQMPPGARFELSFGVNAPSYLEGQTNRAPVEHTLSNTGGDCDTQGYVAFRGTYQESAESDPITMVQLAQVCWRNNSVTVGGDTIGLDDLSAARVFVAAWIDPRFHGCDRKPLDRVWAAADLEWCPVNFLGYNFKTGDLAHRMLLRLLLSTGTASWAGYDLDGAVLTPGNNHPAALDGVPPYSDAEIADLGLGVPADLIDLPTFASTASDLPGGIASPLNRCRYAWIGAQDSQELIAAILAPRGWGLGWNGARWRLFTRAEPISGSQVEVVIRPEDIAGEPEFVEQATLRPFVPRERFKVEFGKALVSEAQTDDRKLIAEVQAHDPMSRSRRDNGVAAVEGWGLIPTSLWRGESPPADWSTAWRTLFADTMAGWYNSAHILITGLPVMPSVARMLGPGSVVRYSSYYAPTREGTYGPTAKLGRVYKVEHDLDTREARVDILLQPGDSIGVKLFAPIAMVVDNVSSVEERHYAAERTFFCYRDFFLHEGEGMHDVKYFAEPAWLGVGGDALVNGWQWDGRTWSQTFSFLVESVNLANNSITYKADSLTGKWWEARYTALVFAKFDDQPVDSWTRSLFAVITKADFKFGAVPTPGFPLA